MAFRRIERHLTLPVSDRSRRSARHCPGVRFGAAVGAGARAAAVEIDADAVRTTALAAAPDLDPALTTIEVARAGGQGDPVTVSVDYDDPVRVPLIGWLFGSSIRMRAEATDRQEFAS
jgi:hypothetical protein